MNRALLTAFATVGLAQFAKVPIKQWQTGEWDWSELFKTGGMPSSHSAGVNSLAAYIALKRGIGSIPFALAGMLSLIVMYDAMGIRRHAGNIAVEVNALEEALTRLEKQHPLLELRTTRKQVQSRLEERLGHLPKEVAGGALLGILTGSLSYVLENTKKKRSMLSWLY